MSTARGRAVVWGEVERDAVMRDLPCTERRVARRSGVWMARECCGRRMPTEVERSYLANMPESRLGALRGNGDWSQTIEKKKMCRVMDEVAR